MNQDQTTQFIDENPIVKAAVENIERRKGKGHSITVDELQEEVDRIESKSEDQIDLIEGKSGIFILKDRFGTSIGTIFGEQDARKMSKAREMFKLIEKAVELVEDANEDEVHSFLADLHSIVDFVKKPKAGI